VFDAKEQFPNLTFEKTPYTITPETLNGKRVICTQSNYYEFITSDIASAENQILVFSPFMTENRLSTLLPVILDAVNRDVKIYVVTKPIDEHGSKSKVSIQLARRNCDLLEFTSFIKRECMKSLF